MKKVLFSILLLHLAMIVNAATYYFSTSSGDDARTSEQAQNSATPWKTIGKLNVIMYTLKPGDKVCFKRGETFDGTINITVSGSGDSPIVFAGYGNGERPVINGFATLTNWVQSRSNVWEANFSPAPGSTNMVVMNNQQQAIGRYPNRNTGNEGYLSINSVYGSSQISSNQLSSSPNWTGGEVVIRKVRWVIDRNTITAHNGNTLTFISGSGFTSSVDYGFFIQNHTNTLDQNGEWYYDNNRKKLQMYFSTNNPSAYSIKGSVTATLVSAINQSNINFRNLAFIGANANTFYFSGCSNILINNCDINYSGGNAIMAINSPYLTFTNSAISNTNNNAVYLQSNCNNALIKNNVIRNTSVIAGMGQSDADTYQAIIVRGDYGLVEYNKIDSSGFNPIQFRGDYTTIKNNYINTFNYIKDDGAGIYNGLGGLDKTVYHSGLITGNIILNGIGATAGTKEVLLPQSAGIYLDDNSNHITVTGNTIAGCAFAGINNHNGHELTITGNTMYNNRLSQFRETRDYISPNPVRNCTVTNNIMFSKDASQLASSVNSIENDISQFGRFDSNHYCRPIDDNFVMYYSYILNGSWVSNYTNLAGWKARFGVDAKSTGAPVIVPASIINSISGINKYANGYYTKDVSNVYGYSTVSDIATTWNAGKLDAGTLEVSARNYAASSNNFLLNLPVGAVTAGKSYMLSFTVLGANSDRTLDVYLRKIGSPYTELTQRTKIAITPNRTNYQFGLVPTNGDDASCVLLEYSQVNGPMWIDNVELQEASVTKTNPDDYIVFQYNATKKVMKFNLTGTYYDAKGAIYTGKVSLQPFTSVVLTKQTANSQFKISSDASLQAIGLQGNLINASAGASASTSASLNWQVENQKINTSRYEVERSSDAVHFTSVGNASVKENVSSVNYEFTDLKPAAGKNYYRIRQYDEKGTYAFSKVVMINNISFKINPNPAHDVVHVMFDQMITADDHLAKEIVIRSATGVVVKTIQLASTDNLNKVDINVSSLTNGMYSLSLTSEGQSFSKPFLKQ